MRYLKLIFLPLLCPILANAQKLPSVQKESLRAPANIKIDGKADEWDSQFKAYNHATELFYTIANDDDDLYLAIRVTNSRAIDKIINGGITFSFKDPLNKKATPLTITYPLILKPDWNKATGALYRKTISTDTLRTWNDNLERVSKEIRIQGCSAISDSSISLYNEYGIKAKQQFDVNKTWTYELAIPLKYLSHLINNDGELKYNIKVNGIAKKDQGAMVDGKQVSVDDPRIQEMMARFAAEGHVFQSYNYSVSPTDFSAIYKLAKP